MDYQATEAEIKRAKSLHSILLFDFIVVHVFVFVAALSLIKTSYLPLAGMAVLSIAFLLRVILKARQSLAQETCQFVRCHHLLAGKRARLFLILFLATGGFTAALLLGGGQMGLSPIAAKALAFGLGQLPFMVVLLALVVMEYDAEHQCKSSTIPAAALALDTPTQSA
jgi:hypothetical protein